MVDGDYTNESGYTEEDPLSPSDPMQTEPNSNDTGTGPLTQYMDALPFNWRLTMRPPAWHPPTDVYEMDNTLVVRVEIAGMREGDFAIELNGRFLVVRGVRQDIPERRAYHRMEIRFGEFSIEIELPSYIEADQVQAIYHNGFLRILLPKSHPRQIPIIE
jgi:HSP20 family protein